jgi:hypothetical protein
VNVELTDRNYVLKAKDYYDKNITIGLGTDNPLIVELAHRPLITISTVQDNVDIYESGRFLSKAPVTEEILNPRTFEFRKDGFFKKSVSLTTAQTHEMGYALNVELKPLPVITIKTAPVDAKIYMTGQSTPIGTGSAELMIEDTTAFEVKADRYYPETFSVEAIKSQNITVNLNPMPYVMIGSSPSGASVTVDGKAIGNTPVEQLIENPVVVQLTKDGYQPKTVTLDSSDLNPVIALEEVPPPVTNEVPAVVEQQKPAKAEKKSFWQKLFGK